MTYPASLLPHLLVGWQKVADRYKMPIYVFQTGDTYHAVSNEAQGVGRLVDTLAPQMLVPEQVTWPKSGVIIARPQGGESRVARGGKDG
jgi:hypothetical protein